MYFAIYLPPKAESTKVPVIYWLSGKKNLQCVENSVYLKLIKLFGRPNFL